METKSFSQDEIIRQLDSAFDQLDNSRASELESAKNLLNIKHQNLQKEKDRLTVKYGKDNPEVRKIEARLSYHDEMFKAMDEEIARSKISTEPFVLTSWRVHGLVLDPAGKKLDSMTVYLVDEKQQLIEGSHPQCSNAQGYYAITLEKELLSKLKGRKLFLAVSGKENTKPLIVTESLLANPGRIDYRDIIVSDESCDAPPINTGENNIA